MILETLFSKEYILYTIIGIIILYFVLKRIFKNMYFYLSTKRFASKSKRLRKKKFNGLILVEYTQKKRKKNTNNFKKLKRAGKRKVKKYLLYKLHELPKITKYAQGKLLKQSHKQLLIFIKNERKTLKKFTLSVGIKPIIQLTNTYDCLDELIQFLHHLPDAILSEKDYDIYLENQGILITYKIK